MEELKRRQQKAALVVRKIIQKLRTATLDNIETLRADLELAQIENLEEMGAEADKVREEAEKVLMQVSVRLEEAAKRREEQEMKRLEEEAKKKEEEARVEALGKAAGDEVDSAEVLVTAASEAAKSVTDGGGKDMPSAEVLQACQFAEESIRAAETAVSEAQQGITEKRKALGSSDAATKLKGVAEFKALPGRLSKGRQTLSKCSEEVRVIKEKALRVVAAAKKDREHKEQFAKYADTSNGGGAIERQGLASFAAQEYGFALNEDQLSKIFSKMAGEGTGIPFEKFSQLRSLVAIEKSVVKAREKAKEDEEKAKRAKEEADRLEKEREGKKALIVESLSAATTACADAEANSLKAKQAMRMLAPEAKPKPSGTLLMEAVSQVEQASAGMKSAVEQVEEFVKPVDAAEEDPDEEVAKFRKEQVAEVRSRAAKTKAVLKKAAEMSVEAKMRCRSLMIQEMESFRLEVVAGIRAVLEAEGITGEELFAMLAGGPQLSRSGFMTLVRSLSTRCPTDQLPERLRSDVLQDSQIEKLFEHCLTGGNEMTKDCFVGSLTWLTYTVAKDTVLTEEKPIKSKVVRRLLMGEVVEALSVPEPDDGGKAGLRRVHCRTASDQLKGWATVSGNQGTVFLQPRGVYYVCTNEAVMTDDISVAESKTVRRISKGEFVQALGLETKDDSIGVLRIQCRAKLDGKTGWVSLAGNKGTTFFQPS